MYKQLRGREIVKFSIYSVRINIKLVLNKHKACKSLRVVLKYKVVSPQLIQG